MPFYCNLLLENWCNIMPPPMSVLIIEDQIIKYFQVKVLLEEQLAVEITWCKDLLGAKRVLAVEEFNWILLDMSFGDIHSSHIGGFAGLEGIHVLQYIYRKRISTPVIICTTHTTFNDPDFGKFDNLEDLSTHVFSVFPDNVRLCIGVKANSNHWQQQILEQLKSE